MNTVPVLTYNLLQSIHWSKQAILHVIVSCFCYPLSYSSGYTYFHWLFTQTKVIKSNTQGFRECNDQNDQGLFTWTSKNKFLLFPSYTILLRIKKDYASYLGVVPRVNFECDDCSLRNHPVWAHAVADDCMWLFNDY